MCGLAKCCALGAGIGYICLLAEVTIPIQKNKNKIGIAANDCVYKLENIQPCKTIK